MIAVPLPRQTDVPPVAAFYLARLDYLLGKAFDRYRAWGIYDAEQTALVNHALFSVYRELLALEQGPEAERRIARARAGRGARV